MSTTVSANSLCDYCHQKPKFGNHPFCGKTCAAQAAANFCIQCHQKPKHTSYDYCGKKCAAQAQLQKKPLAPSTNNSVPNGPTQPYGVGALKANAPTWKPQPAVQSTSARQPIPGISEAPQNPQMRPVAQYVQTSVASVPHVFSGGPSAPAGALPQTYPHLPQANPFLANTNTVPAPRPNGPPATGQQPNAYPGTFACTAAAPAEPESQVMCRIPGCDEPAYVDEDGGITSEYCSMRHREEAVMTGLAPACIMCGDLPQSSLDYFCSKICREESMRK